MQKNAKWQLGIYSFKKVVNWIGDAQMEEEKSEIDVITADETDAFNDVWIITKLISKVIIKL